MSVELPTFVLQSLLNTIESQCLLIRGFMKQESVAPVVAPSSLAFPINSESIEDESENINRAYISNLESDNRELKEKIQNLIIEQATHQKEFERGFKEGLKMAQQEHIVENQVLPRSVPSTHVGDVEQIVYQAEEILEKFPQNTTIETEDLPDVEEERADLDGMNHVVEQNYVNVSEEQSVQKSQSNQLVQHSVKSLDYDDDERKEIEYNEGVEVGDDDENDNEDQEQEENEVYEVDECEAEEESPEFEEIEVKGQTYYLDTESLQFYKPTDEGEIDVENPIGRKDNKSGRFLFFKR